MNKIKYFIVIQFLFSQSLCEVNNDQKEKFLSGFLKHYNSLPNQVYYSEEGSLQNTQQEDDTTYKIEANLKVVEINNNQAKKSLKCIAFIKDSDNEVTVISSNCEEAADQPRQSDGVPETSMESHLEVTEPTVERKPVQLDNEVQQDTAITSGEQFIAIPRDQPRAPCIGCASHVNPQAAGVSDLAELGVRHLDLHEPSVKHSLATVNDVERQVQVVNGVRYILTLSINFNNCTQVESENCASSKICKITILVKPWVKLSNGGNYRAILANNCTKEWQFGDNGEVLPEPLSNNNQKKENSSGDPADTNAFDDDIQVKHDINVQSQPNQEKTLSEDDIKKIQEQIITDAQFQAVTESNKQSFTLSPDLSDVSKQHVFKAGSEKYNENSIPVTESQTTEQQAFKLNVDKKKAIDDMLDFFDFAGFKPKTEVEEVVPRVRRSYDYDLQVLSLAEDYHGIKNSILNARFMYEMAQAMVDYMNEMDMEVKNRAVKNVIRAEEEKEDLHRFVYIQARVTIPCDKVECEPREVDTQICNGVIDCINENSPQILSTFCYNDNKESDYREDIREVALNDPVLRRLAEEAVKEIESESKSQYAMRLNKIASAITQVTSGTLTKFSVIIENIKCNKSVPLPLRENCTVLEQLGSKICDVIVLERHWLKEKKMSYSCTDRPADMRISKSKKVSNNITVDDPQIIEMLQEAIQYLESQSDKTNKQKIVNIKSISSQIIAGFLTKIEFVVGYTDCKDDNYSRDQINKCELLKGEGLRLCKAQIWDRSWIMDGRQIEVSCDDVLKNNEILKTRKKRSIDFGRDDQQSLNKDNEVDYKKLANESLYRFMRSSSSNQHYEVVKVDKTMVPDVSRKLIKIEFSISPTNCVIQSNGILSSSKCNIVNPKNILHCRSKILENNWIDKKQYFVKCNIKYQQQLKNTNTIKERKPSDPKYYQLAAESLKKYLHDTGNPPHTIVRVEKVTTQIVAGLLTRIDFIVSPKNLSNSKTVRCHSEILEKHWMGTKAFNVSCQLKQDVKTMDHTVEIHADNPKYMQIAVESLQKYIKNHPESNLVRVAFVDKVERKSEKLKIRFIASHAEEDNGDTLCNAEVTETKQSKSDIEVKCYLIDKLFIKSDITENDPNYNKYVQLADESLRNYIQKMNSSLYTVVTIEGVAVLWDDGIKTLINFTISPVDIENTDLLQGKHCIAEILEQPWLQNSNNKNIQIDCKLDKDLYRTKREALNDNDRRIIGGLQEQNPSLPEYKALAEESLRKYIIDSGITDHLAVLQVEKVTTQVVAGSLTRIDFLVSGSPGANINKCHSEIWTKPWINFKQITVICENDGHRGKRELIGGEQNQDPTKPEYRLLAEESLRKHIKDHGITDHLAVLQVEKVTTQVVAGSLTRIDFLVSGSPGANINKCHSEIWTKPWINFKQITVTCENDGHRGKRELIGGEQNQDPTKPEYRFLAEESLRKHIKDHGITDHLAVLQVEKVTTQVVAGSLTRIDFLVSGSPGANINKCHSEIWTKPWINFKQITVTCENDGHRGKRELIGGEQNQDPTKPEYRLLAEESLRKHIKDHGITDHLAVLQVEKVTTQVVAGSLTRIDFLVSGSPGANINKCHSEIWTKPWINFKQITVICENDGHRGKRELIGGEQNQDPTKPEYRLLAEESLRKHIKDHGITDHLAVLQVEKVTTQVVAGSLTRIDFLVSGSPGANINKCHSEIWTKPWINFKQITVICENDGHRGKRELIGGEQNQDPTKPEYRLLAEESLRKHIKDHGITDHLAVLQVEKVTTQVVAGSLTRIDFLVSGSPGANINKCHSEIWTKPWINFKQIAVTCENDGHRGKRELIGGEQNQDPSKPEYRLLAEESLRKHIKDHGITDHLAVLQVEKVTTQVVAGSLTRIDFLVSGSPGANINKCHSEIWTKPWINFKQITVICENDGHRGKRELIGGEQNQDPTKPEYRLLAEESLRKHIKDHGITDHLAVLQVEKVTTQVVAGSLTRIDFLVSGSPGANINKCHSEIWTKPWINFKQITVICENDGHRGKRELIGGEQNQDPTKLEYRLLAEESLRKHIKDHGITDHLAVLQVEKVTTQVVAGSLTRIDFLVSGSPGANINKCHSEIWTKPWINFKQITVICENDGHRGKRELIGGEQNQDPTKPEYRLLAEESLRKHIKDHGITDHLAVLQVEKVTTQVVAGALTRIDFLVSGSLGANINKCHSEIWTKPWINFKQITVTCENDGHRGKRELIGGEQNQDPTKPEYRLLAEESLRKHIKDHGITDHLAVLQVEKVTTQVVAGSLTRIDFLVSGSPGANINKCHSEIWTKPWINFKQITVICENDGHRGKRELIGGEQNQDPTKPEYRLLAEESLRKHIKDHGITDHLAVLQVEKVTTQVVAGSLTRIDFLVSGSPGANINKCHSEIWTKPWINFKQITVICENDGHRGKRELIGGEQNQDLTKPEYRLLAEESLRKYITDNGITDHLVVVQVERVTTQVVAGSMTRIDFLVSGSPGANINKCHSEIWTQPWKNFKQITVTCENNAPRDKRYMAGGEVDQDPTEPEYRLLAEESLRKHIIDHGIKDQLVVVQVEKVTIQVVAGIMTRIDFLVSGTSDAKINKCHSEIWTQAWKNFKRITVTCENNASRDKRDMAGGEVDQDPTEPEYRLLAEESLRKHIIDHGIKDQLVVLQVEKVTTQVVAGIMTRIDFLVSASQGVKINKCHSEIWTQPWKNFKQITVTCENNGPRGKKLAGGEQEQDPTKPEYRLLAEESLRKHIIDLSIKDQLVVAQVEKVTTQVVAGIITRIDFLVSSGLGAEINKCHSEIWSQEWTHSRKITVTCENDYERMNTGGIVDEDPTNPEYRLLAEESLRKYLIDNGIKDQLVVVQVEKVTSQLVAGTMTRIDFLVSGSPGAKINKCHSEIWTQVWSNIKEIRVTCSSVNGRVKRDLGSLSVALDENISTPIYKILTVQSTRGNTSNKSQQYVSTLRGRSEEEQDPTKPEYKLMAEESLRKLYKKKSTVYHTVLDIQRVFTRVVSGIKYKIDFTAAPTACSANISSLHARSCKPIDNVILYCHTEIWDKPWLKQKKIDVQCNDPNNENFSEDESDNDLTTQKSNVDKFIQLAEEATEKYLTTSNRKYVHKVTEILSSSEQVANDTLTNINFTISPTTCLRNETTNNTLCKLKQPLVVFNCNTNIRVRQLQVEKEIKVTCKKVSETKDKKRKSKSGVRTVRQIVDDDDEIDEDTAYYYADRAVQHINDRSNSNNLNKLISIYAVKNSVQMGTMTIKMYIEVAETYCLRHHKTTDLRNCEEMSGLNHRLCLARLWPSPDDELVVRQVSVVCDDEEDFMSVTGVNIMELIRISLAVLESPPENKFKLVHQGEPQLIPSLDSRRPFKLNFVVSITNCSKDVNLDKNPFQCFLNPSVPPRNCHSLIWLKPEAKFISNVDAQCSPLGIARYKRSALESENGTDYSEIQSMVKASLEQLEMQSLHRYKQRVLQINSHSTKITSGKVTTIDFDVGYTSCLKYEWVANITSCNFLEHLPRRRCVAQIWQRLWIKNGKNIDVNCVDDETPLESHIEFESAEMANELARQALKHIEAKYPHPAKQKVVRIFSLEKQVVAGIHYKMKIEVGFTDCVALSEQKECKLIDNHGLNKFCRVNVWIRPWTDHPPNFRVSCDYQEGNTHDLYHQVQAEQLFYNFLTTYSPSYVNNYSQMHKRFEIFKHNIKKIHELNVHEKGTAVYGVTRFTDLTYEEFRTTYMGLNTNLTNENQVPMKQADIPSIKVPENFDWRDYDAVTEVKDQGSCGSCWAFSVTGNIEGQWKMQSGQLVSLSEQELVDCDKLDNGCNGGLPDNAYRAIEQLGGLELESDYPYEGTDDKCTFNKTLAKVQISSAVNITTNETGMAQWLVHNGPISIGINANAMQFYMGGISHPWKALCNPTNLDHGVLIVGYGVKDYPVFHKKIPYWIIKNSWGKSWGEQGYYRVFRGDGTCGVNQMASSAVI